MITLLYLSLHHWCMPFYVFLMLLVIFIQLWNNHGQYSNPSIQSILYANDFLFIHSAFSCPMINSLFLTRNVVFSMISWPKWNQKSLIYYMKRRIKLRINITLHPYIVKKQINILFLYAFIVFSLLSVYSIGPHTHTMEVTRFLLDLQRNVFALSWIIFACSIFAWSTKQKFAIDIIKAIYSLSMNFSTAFCLQPDEKGGKIVSTSL